MPLASLTSLAGRFVSDLVRNLKDRFSHVDADFFLEFSFNFDFFSTLCLFFKIIELNHGHTDFTILGCPIALLDF